MQSILLFLEMAALIPFSIHQALKHLPDLLWTVFLHRLILPIEIYFDRCRASQNSSCFFHLLPLFSAHIRAELMGVVIHRRHPHAYSSAIVICKKITSLKKNLGHAGPSRLSFPRPGKSTSTKAPLCNCSPVPD